MKEAAVEPDTGTFSAFFLVGCLSHSWRSDGFDSKGAHFVSQNVVPRVRGQLPISRDTNE